MVRALGIHLDPEHGESLVLPPAKQERPPLHLSDKELARRVYLDAGRRTPLEVELAKRLEKKS
jgi:hypothetical protein